jgi:hypothetical protein
MNTDTTDIDPAEVSRVFSVLIEADPVPDPHTVRSEKPADVVPLRPVYTGSEPMQTIDPETELTYPPPNRARRSWIAAAAAAVIVLIGIGVLLVNRGDDTEDQPVDQPVTTPVPTTELPPQQALGPEDEAAAQAAALDFLGAIDAGDIETVEAMEAPADVGGGLLRVWQMNAYIGANGKGVVLGDECHISNSSSSFIDVGCDATMTDPVSVALGDSELVLTVRYLPDGSVQSNGFYWGQDFRQTNEAYAEYLREFHPDQYAAVCDWRGYDGIGDGGLALDRACAELWVPLQDDVAAWVVETDFGS